MAIYFLYLFHFFMFKLMLKLFKLILKKNLFDVVVSRFFDSDCEAVCEAMCNAHVKPCYNFHTFLQLGDILFHLYEYLLG